MTSSPAFVSAQDFFFSFDEFSRAPSGTTTTASATGSVFIFSDANVDFNNLDLDFTNSDSSVIAFTGGTTFNAGGKFVTFNLSDPNDSMAGPTATDGRLFATSGAFQPGQIPSVQDADFRPGANGFLLAQVDYDIIGPGTANFDFILGDLGISDFAPGPGLALIGDLIELDPIFQSGELTVTEAEVVPEPSSAILLILGATGMIARRRRS